LIDLLIYLIDDVIAQFIAEQNKFFIVQFLLCKYLVSKSKNIIEKTYMDAMDNV